MTDPIPNGLGELERRVAYDLSLLNLPAKPWMPPTRGPGGEEVLNVAIVGAGLCGLVAAAALRFAGVDKVRLFDRAPENREGPWITYARMQTLRTPKMATGPALGLPSLTFRAWFEAQWGRAAWEALAYADRVHWMDYLIWYRRMTAPDVVNGVEVTAITEDGPLLRLTVAGRPVLARRVVLATGLDSLGAPYLPLEARGLPSHLVKHSSDELDLASLRGKRVVVVGAGASAMDNAAAALEAGAARVDLLIRRADIPRIDKLASLGDAGTTHGYGGMRDADRWDFMAILDSYPAPPPRHSVLRVARHDNVRLRVSSPVTAMRQTADGLELDTPSGTIAADLAIFATGFRNDLSRRPELASFAADLRLWGDQVGPESAARHPALATFPYLAGDFTFTEKVPGTRPALSRIACFAYPSLPSQGKLASGIPGVSDGARTLVNGLVRSFYAEDSAFHIDKLRRYDDPILFGDEWQAPAPA